MKTTDLPSKSYKRLFRKEKLTDLSPAPLQNFINAEFKKGYSKKTMTITHSVLKNALNMAVYPWG